jgi:hypothetical protein
MLGRNPEKRFNAAIGQEQTASELRQRVSVC